MREAQDAARLIGLPIDILKASTGSEIDAAFASLVCERVEALFVAADGFFTSRRIQFAARATQNGIATAFGNR
jgi:hypothetical protein